MAMPPLRPYQLEPLRAITRSVLERQGRTFTIMMSRQAGKNELSAQLEVLLLTLFSARGGDAIKASPTFRPQTMNSIDRLARRLNDAGFGPYWQREHGNAVRLGNARCLFFSAAPAANVVGATVSIALEIDEAQDVLPEKYAKDFRPMGSTANATSILYGTAWDDSTLLETTKQHNIEMERQDGIRRHFEYDWQTVAGFNPDYRRYVEGERARLGEAHPLFRTQYALRTIAGEGRAFSPAVQEQLLGDHPRQTRPEPGKIYVAGVDLAGEAETAEDEALRSREPRRDSTVVTIGEIVPAALPRLLANEPFGEYGDAGWRSNSGDEAPGARRLSRRAFPPGLRVVAFYRRTGVRHAALYGALVDLLGETWRCRRVVVDATGVGAGVASFLRDTLRPSVVEPFVFTSASKSALAFQLLAAAGSGRLKLYLGDDPDARACRQEIALARTAVRPSGLIDLSVDASEGHDDFVMSLALAIEAAESYRSRTASGRPGTPATASLEPLAGSHRR